MAQCPASGKAGFTSAVLKCPNSQSSTRLTTGTGRAWIHQNGCCDRQHSCRWVDTLFLLFSTSYVIRGINRSISVNSGNYYCCAHKKGNQKFTGQSALHSLYPRVVCCIPEPPIRTSSLLPGGKGFTIANSVRVPSIRRGTGQCFSCAGAEEKNPSLPQLNASKHIRHHYEKMIVYLHQIEAVFPTLFTLSGKTMRSRTEKTERACEETETKMMDTPVY